MTETPEIDSEQAFLDSAVVIALGSNLPGTYASSRELLDAALRALDEHGLRVARASGWWRSRAWPEGSGPDFLNGTTLVETDHLPAKVLTILHSIERNFGRQRLITNAPRTLDLDLIAYGRFVANKGGLKIPHPRAAQRRFVMEPLASIAPAWLHPVERKTATALSRLACIGVDAQREPGSP